MRKLIEEAEENQDCPNPRFVVRPSVGAKNVSRLESRHNKHSPVKSVHARENFGSLVMENIIYLFLRI